MDCAPNINIFQELQVLLETGCFSGQISPEEDWQQTCYEMEKYLKDEPHLRPDSRTRNRAKQLSPCGPASKLISKTISPTVPSTCLKSGHQSAPIKKKTISTSVDLLFDESTLTSWDIFSTPLSNNDYKHIPIIDDILDNHQTQLCLRSTFIFFEILISKSNGSQCIFRILLNSVIQIRSYLFIKDLPITVFI
jgi:hypothetical protein